MKRFPFVLAFAVLSAGCGCQISLGGGSIPSVVIDQRVEREEVLPLDLGPRDVLDLSTSYGRIEVVAGAERPELRATLHASGRTKEEAQAVLDRFQLELVRGPDGVRAEVAGEPLVINEGSARIELSAHADFVATVPVGTSISAESGSGDIVTRGALGSLRLDTRYGRITIEEARGEVRAESGSGDVEVARLDCRTSGDGLAELESGYGNVTVDEARAVRVSCVSGSGDLRVGSAEVDALELKTNYGKVEVQQASGALRAESGSGDVRLKDVRGAVTAKSGYGKVEVEGVISALDATSGSGDVRVKARAESRVETDWNVSSNYGAVVLEVPEGFACALDAHTDYGSIECDFPVTIEAGKRKDRDLRGTVGAGGGTVRLSSGSGDVALKRR